MPPVVNRSHVGVLTPLYADIHSENFKSCHDKRTLIIYRTIESPEVQ
jgi:hypothetical protein